MLHCSCQSALPAWRWKTIPCLHTSRVVGGKIIFLFERNTGRAEISEQHENNRCCSLTKLQEEGEAKAAYMREGSMLGELNKQTNETQVPPTDWQILTLKSLKCILSPSQDNFERRSGLRLGE